jgi:prepilin peptidase CpaA
MTLHKRKEEITFKEIFTIGFLLFASLLDIKSFCIPNRLILFGWLFGIGYRLFFDGYRGLPPFFYGALLPIVLLWILFHFHMLGAGDIKLFSVIGGLYGAPFTLRVIITAFLLGAVMSVVHLLRYRNLMYRLHYLAEYVSMYVRTGERTPYYVKKRDGKEAVIHFAVSIFGGFLLCILEKGGAI